MDASSVGLIVVGWHGTWGTLGEWNGDGGSMDYVVAAGGSGAPWEWDAWWRAGRMREVW